jgi:hypothetical protein
MTPNVSYYLELREKNRNKRLLKVKTREAKLKTNKAKNERLTKHTNIAKMELRKRQGTYRRGMNLDDPEEEVAKEQPTCKKAAAKGGKPHCEFCGMRGHVRKSSAKCKAKEARIKKFQPDGSLLTDPPVAEPPAAPEALLTPESLLAQDDCDEMDSMPFDADYESEEDNAENLALLLLEDVGSDDESDEPLQNFTI